MGLNPAQESDTALLPRLLNRSISAARILLLCAAMIIVPAGLYYYLVIQEQINYRDQRAFRSLGEVQLQLSQAIEVAKAFSLYAPVSDFHVGLADFAREHEVLLQAQDSLPKPRMADVVIAEKLKGRAPEVFWDFVSPLDQQQTFSDLLAPEAASQLVAEQILNVVRLEIGDKKTRPQNWKHLNLAQLQAKKNETVVAYFARLALLAKCAASPPVRYADSFETALGLHLCEEAKDASYPAFDAEREAIKLIYEKAEKECEVAFKNTENKSKKDQSLAAISKPEKPAAQTFADKKEEQETLKACALNNLRAWMPKGSKTAEELALRMHAGLSLAKTSAPYSLRKNVPECRKNNGTSLAFWSEQTDNLGTARIYRCGARDQQIPVEIALKNFLGQGNWFDALDAVYLVREDGKVLLTLQKPITRIAGESKLYQPATMLPKVLDLLALLDDKSSAGETDKAGGKPRTVGARMRDFEIDNREVRAYTQQVQLPVRFCSSKSETCANEKLFLVGAREQHLMAATQMLEPGTFLLWLCVLLVVLFFWPWLNLFFSQQLQAVPARSVFALVSSSLLLVLPIVLGLWAWGSYRAAVDVMKESAKNVAVKMAKNWQAELDTAVSELMEQHNKWTDTRLIPTSETADASAFKLSHSHFETLQDKNNKAYFDCFILTTHTGQQARVRNCVPHAAFLASDLASDLVSNIARPLPVMASVFEFDREGRIDKKILQYTQLLPAYGAAATAEGRGYLQTLVNHQAWPWPKPKKIAGWSLDGFVIERLYNRADAQLSSQLALAVHKDEDKDKGRQFISGSFPAYSFEFMPPPPGFQYVVIDNQTGVALYHSAPGRVLAENLFNESQQDNRLLAAVKYGNTDSFGGHYHGHSVQFHVQPLAYVPWTLVMIAELRPVQLGLANITLLTLGFCLSPLLVLLACYVLARLSGKRAAWAWPQWQLRRRYRPLCGLLLVHAISQYLVLAGLSYLSFVIANALIVISTLAINVALLSQAGKWAAPDSVVWLAQRVWQRIAPKGALMPANISAWQLCAFALLLLCQIVEALLLLSSDAMWHGVPLLLPLLSMLATSLLLRRSLLRIATEISSEADSGSATSSQPLYQAHQAIPDFYRDYRRWAVLVMAILVWLPASVMLRNSADQIEQRLQYVAGVALAERWQAQQQKLQDLGQIHFPDRFESNERFVLPAKIEQGLREIFPVQAKLQSFQFAATQPPAHRTCSESKSRESTFTQLALEFAGKLTPDQAMLFAAGDAISQQTPKRYKTGKFAGDDEDYCVIDSGASATELSSANAANGANRVDHYAVFLPRINGLLSWPGRLALLLLACVISSLALRGLMRTVLSAKFVAHFPPAPALALPEKWARHSDAPKRLLLQRELAPLSPSLRLQIEAELDITKSLHETVLMIGKLALQAYRNRWDKLPESQQQLLYLVARGNYPLPTHSPAVEGLLRLGCLNHDPQLQVASESLRRFVLRAAPEAKQRLWEAPPPGDLWQTLRYPLGVAIMLLLAWVALVGGDMLKILAGGVASATGLLAAFKQVQQIMKGGS